MLISILKKINAIPQRTRFFVSLLVTLDMGLVYWLLVMLYLPDNNGWRWLINNPGISIFETVFKPMAIGILAATLPNSNVIKGCMKLRALGPVLLVFLMIIGILIGLQDANHARTKRVIPPFDVSNQTKRKALLIKDIELRCSMNNSRPGKNDDSEYGELACNGVISSNSDTAQPLKKIYQDAAHGILNNPSYFHNVSAAAIWTGLMTMLSLISISFSFWCLIVIAFSRTKLPSQTFENMLLCFAFFSAWFPLRIYSEWYANYSIYDLAENYPIIYFAAACGLVFIFMLILLKIKNVMLKAIIGSVSGGSATLSILAGYNNTPFKNIFNFYAGINIFGFLALEITLFIILLASIFYYSKDIEI